MLSFELKKQIAENPPDELEIYLDATGLEALLAQLRFLEEKRTDHLHLMSESWGGTHLDDMPQDSENMALHHVKILLR